MLPGREPRSPPVIDAGNPCNSNEAQEAAAAVSVTLAGMNVWTLPLGTRAVHAARGGDA
jgi:hypothetical protein